MIDYNLTKLLNRSTAQKQTHQGNPWDSIPIKNRKNARETTEIHMGNLGIQELVEFEKFPNLEVLWLNGNKVFYNYFI